VEDGGGFEIDLDQVNLNFSSQSKKISECIVLCVVMVQEILDEWLKILKKMDVAQYMAPLRTGAY